MHGLTLKDVGKRLFDIVKLIRNHRYFCTVTTYYIISTDMNKPTSLIDLGISTNS